ncbi:MAG: biopolymer transporter ExbD [Gammaproteobacteria bacterium]|nr:biopolymer transporter ExbD [Gammaproteobacteria bacterium]
MRTGPGTLPGLKYERRNRRLSLTPLIDCVFILLVFFMLQTNFFRPHTIEFAKAAGSSGAVSGTDTVSIEIHDNGTIWLNGTATDIEALQNYAAGIIYPDATRVVLGVDPGVVLQRAVDIMDLFNRHGISSISMTAAQQFD